MSLVSTAHLSYHFVPIDEQDVFSAVQDALSVAARKKFAKLVAQFCVEVGLWRERTYGYAGAEAEAPGRYLALARTHDADELVGYAACLPVNYLNREKQGLVTEVIVQEEYRGQGVGKQLLETIEMAVQEHTSSLRTIIPASNWRAMDFFMKSGYEITCKGDSYLLHRSIPH